MSEHSDLLESGWKTTLPHAPDVVLSRGEGVRVFDMEGREYLDLLGGIGVNVLGHGHPTYVKAVQEQVAKLGQVSNFFFNEPQLRLQAELTRRTFADRVYFCNSGAEATEAALKLARRYHSAVRGEPRTGFVAMHGGFHGRTFGALSATGQPKYHAGFGPLVPGFEYAKFNDLDDVARLVGPDTAAVILEPIQGECGVIPASPSFLTGVAELCRDRGALLILDEVQTGMGRTGSFLAQERYEVVPDITTIAKGLGGGLPLGAMLCSEEVSGGFVVGSHATTFGGNPVVTAAGLAVLEAMDAESLLENCRTVGERLRQGLTDLSVRHERLGEVRGEGLMLAVECEGDTHAVVAASRKAGLLHNSAGDRALRFLPPLILSESDVDEGIVKLDAALQSCPD